MSLMVESEKRQKLRVKADEAYLDIFLTFPKNTKLVCEVLDLNESGLAFKMLASDGYFPPGTPLRRMKLFQQNNKRGKSLAGIVRHTRAFHNDGELCYKIGVEFIDIRNFSTEKITVPFPIRPKRYTAKKLFKKDAKATFFTMEGVRYSGRLIDFSNYGAGLELVNITPLIRISDTLKDFVILIDEEVIYSGEATVARLLQSENVVHLGISFKESILDLSKVLSIHLKSGLNEKFKEFGSYLNFVNEKISVNYKAEIADLRFFLERIKDILDKEEKKIFADESTLSPNQDILLANIIQEGCQYIEQKIDSCRIATQNLSETEGEQYRSYFRHHLLPLFFHSPFLSRGFHKPLGYAGDYQLMNFLYRDGFGGKNLFAKFLDNYCYTENSAKAVVNRVPYLVHKITEIIKKNKSKNSKSGICITSVGSGPAKELQILTESSDILNGCCITLIDSDSESLFYAQNKLLTLRTRCDRRFELKFIPCSVTQLLSDNYKLPNQDLIYSIGLFDYLEDTLAKALVKKFYDSTNEKGMVIIGNVDPSNKTKFFIEYVMDWYIIYRTMPQLSELASHLKSNKLLIDLECEETKTNNFMVIKKT